MSWSCSRGDVDARILRAEALVDSFPDSALAIMRTVDSTRLRGERERAMYALTLTRAEDRNYIDRTDDSLIAIAVRYFDRHDDPRRRMLSYFYHGSILFAAKHYPEAALAYNHALWIADELDDNFWKGRCAAELSNVYLKTYRSSDCLEYAKKSLSYLNKTEETTFRNFAFVTLAGAYLNDSQYREAVEICRQGLDSIKGSSDEWMIHLLQRVNTKSLYGLHEYDKVIDSASGMRIDSLEDADILYYIESARVLLGKEGPDILECDTLPPSAYIYRFLKGSKDGNLSFAIEALDSLLDIESSTLQSSLNENFNLSFSEALNKQNKLRKLEEDNAQKERIIFILSFILVVIILLYMGFLIYRKQQNRIKVLNREIEIELSNIDTLKQSLDLLNLSHEEYRLKLGVMILHRFKELDKVCAAYFSSSLKIKNAIVQKRIDELIYSYSENNELISELEDFVDTNENNLMRSFRNVFPSLKRADYLLFLYSSIGLSANTITLFLKEEKIESVYNRKARLKRKILSLESAESEKFLKILG